MTRRMGAFALLLLSAALTMTACSGPAAPGADTTADLAVFDGAGNDPGASPVQFASQNTAQAESWGAQFIRAIDSGRTSPVPAGVYRRMVYACTVWPDARGELAGDSLVWSDGLACTYDSNGDAGANFREVSSIDMLKVDVSTCAETRAWYAGKGVDWKAHSDGVVFAAECHGKSDRHIPVAAWTLEDGGEVYATDGREWRRLSTMAEIQAYLKRSPPPRG